MADSDQKKQFQETKRHGSRLFPFNIYPCTIPLDFPFRGASLAQRNGTGLCEKRPRQDTDGNGTVYRREGDIFVIPPGTLHAIYQKHGYSMEYENIIFGMDFARRGRGGYLRGEYLMPVAAGELLPPVRLDPEEEGYREAADCLQRMEKLCGQRGYGFQLGG